MLFNVPTVEPNLFRDLEQFRNEVNRIFTNAYDRYAPSAAAQGSFPINLYVGDEELVLTAEMPGVAPQAMELTVEDGVLTLSFERKPDELSQGTAYHRRERAYGRFSRSLELPVRVDADKVEARADNGVLQVRLPRLAEDKPRKITIKATA